MEEAIFLSALRDRPDDDTTRLIYADWLDENDQPERAAFLRMEKELTDLADEERATELRTRLRELAGRLEPVWLAVVSKPAIENCHPHRQELEVEYECPLRWDHLRPLGMLSERYCDSCQRIVYYCDSIEHASSHAMMGDCVAIDARVLRGAEDLPLSFAELGFMGLIRPPSPPEWDRAPDEEEDGVERT
jgi:uncharacterized protein (TIGR02996 family)